jgi:hypothetical protein
LFQKLEGWKIEEKAGGKLGDGSPSVLKSSQLPGSFQLTFKSSFKLPQVSVRSMFTLEAESSSFIAS